MTEASKLEFQAEDLQIVRVLLEEIDEPLSLAALVQAVLERKKAGVTKHRIKIFDPRSDYQVGDLVLKKYDETLRAGKTRTIHINEEVLLKVVDSFKHPVLPCTMLEVSYDGAGPFKLHTEFMMKTGAKLLLACAQVDPPIEPRYLEDREDPRVKAQETTPEEEAAYSQQLTEAVASAPTLLHWEDCWFLGERKIEINPGIIHRAEKLIRDHGGSLLTEQILSEIFSTNAGDVKFPMFAVSFNHTLDHFYRKKFVCVSFESWGRWNLAENLDAKKNAVPGLQERLVDLVESIEGEEEILARKRERLILPFLLPSDDRVVMCLSFRDITAGCLRPIHMPAGFLGNGREIPVRCGDQTFMIDYFPDSGLLLGFGGLFANTRQGDRVTLSRGQDGFVLGFETTSHRATGTGFRYDDKRDLIVAADEPRSSFGREQPEAIVTAEELQKIDPLQAEAHRRRDLYEATARLFSALGDSKRGFPMHVLKLYHLTDALSFVPWERFIRLLLSYPAFYQRPEDLNEGVFRLDVTKVSFDLVGVRPIVAPVAAVPEFVAPVPAVVASEEESAAGGFGFFAEKLQAALGTSKSDKKGAKQKK